MVFAPPSLDANAVTGYSTPAAEAMSSRASQPGKTAPRLLYDASRLDRRNLVHDHNVLTSPPPPFDGSSPQAEVLSDHACRHNLAIELNHSLLPPQDYQPAHRGRYEAESVCRKCRVHLRVEVDYLAVGRRPCPNQDYPLHHFVYRGEHAPAQYSFACSSPDCGARVEVQYTEPAVTDKDLELLADEAALKRRYDSAVNSHAGRQGFRLSTPVNTLWTLRRYIRDSLASDSASKKIPAINKRFLESFGQDCNDLFARLGFKYAGDGEEAVWYLPQTLPHQTTLDPARLHLERWDAELQILIEQFCARDGDLNPAPDYVWQSAIDPLERLLAAHGYEKVSSARRHQDLSAIDHPYFAALGSLADFSDTMVGFCFERQSDCDPENAPYYFDCLQGLAKSRNSEALQVKATMLESQGVVGLKDVTEAYQYLDVDPRSTDDFIANKYRSRLEDTGPSMHSHMKLMLQRLGRARGSQKLLDAASDSLETYQQALAYLNADATYNDEFILTMHTTKTVDDPSSDQTARQAVKIIAETRKSDMLLGWLNTGEMKDSGMGVDEACLHLNMQLDLVAENMLPVVFESARKDNPGFRTEEAIAAVTRALAASRTTSSRNPSTWPVGLTSHGNTCYLNSLLQYYFTIKPLRDIVLDFDNHKFDLSRQSGKDERVGQLKVRPFEIRAYQRFVGDLSNLFDRMIKDPGTTVKPEADLVCRAFLKAEDTDAHVVSSTGSDAGKDSAGHEDVQMTTEASQTESLTDTVTLAGSPSIVPSRPASAASTATVAVTDKEDVPDIMTSSTMLPPSPPSSRPSSRAGAKEDFLAAPPLPPRNLTTPERQQTNLSKAEEAARQQQDVTEVMDEILFRLRAAIQSKGTDARGEQLDLFRDMFFMRIADRTLAEDQDKVVREDGLDVSNIFLNLPSEPTDIYSALDQIFDLQTIDHAGTRLSQYKSLQTLPPILQINIPRNTYDRATGQGKKVEFKMHLEDSLFVDRYFESQEDDILGRRKQCWTWRKQLKSIEAEKEILSKTGMDVDGAQALDLVGDYLANLSAVNEDLVDMNMPAVNVSASLPADVKRDAAEQRQKLAAIDGRVAELKSRIAAQFEGLERMKYRLQAVFFHRGGYGHGHYWTYIHDFQNDVWRIYNDEKVDEFTKLNDIFDAESWQQGTPTCAIYVRDDVREEYVQAVCREPEQPAPQAEAPDKVMQDASQWEQAEGPKADQSWSMESKEYTNSNVEW